MTRMSPWPRQQTLPSSSGQDRRLHLKTTELPKLTENNEFGITVLSKQRFVITVPTNTRVPSPVKVQVRGGRHLPLSTPRLHQGCAHWQAVASTAVQCVALQRGLARTHTNKYTRNHKGTAHAVWYDPFLTQSPVAAREEKRFFPWRAPRNNHAPDPAVFSNCDQTNMVRITVPGPSGSGE